MSKFITQGMGWIPDLPDPRDYTYRHKKILPIFQQPKPGCDDLPDEVDLTHGDEGEVFLSDVDNQGPLNSSTAFAVLSLIEYFERRQGRTFSGSKLFLYKVARNLRSSKFDLCSDTGADLRTTFKCLRHFGVPSEEFWPYDPALVNEEPPAFVYQAAKRVADFHYFRLGTPDANAQQNISQKTTEHVFSTSNGNRMQWNLLTSVLSAGFPVAFGFSVPSSITADPGIPFRCEYDRYLGGMAVLAIGYNSHHFGRNLGALLVRTSWGNQWGDDGNGWLPRTYIESGLASDFWTVSRDVTVAGTDT